MIKTLRLQLTAWYLAFFSLLLLTFCGLLYSGLSRALERRLDESLTSEANTATALMREELEEMHGDSPRAARDVLSEIQPQGIGIVILEQARTLAASGTVLNPGQLETHAARLATEDASDSTAHLPDWGAHGARAAAHRFSWTNRPFTVVIVSPLDAIAQELQAFRQALWLSLPPLLALAGFGGYWLTRRRLAPLEVMAAQTRRITSENLGTRLEIGSAAEELATLAASFNQLLARLDQSFESMRRFVQDASHEIRTPLAVIRGEAQVALSQARSPAEYQETLAVIHDESRRLSTLVEDLLNLARADSGGIHLRREALYINELVVECCRLVQPLAAARTIRLASVGSADVPFQGDEELLRRMVLNLLDNAIRYTPPGGDVIASVEFDSQEIRINVSDTGVGIAPEHAAHVFERFYRVDQARSRPGAGAANGCFGLGLAIVKWIVEAHQGAITIRSQPGAGSTFTASFAHPQRTAADVSLPLATFRRKIPTASSLD